MVCPLATGLAGMVEGNVSGTPFIIYDKYVSPVVHKSNSWIYDRGYFFLSNLIYFNSTSIAAG